MFPTDLVDLPNPDPKAPTNSPVTPLAGGIANLNAVVEALQAKVGVNGSTVPTSIDKRLAAVETLAAGSLQTADFGTAFSAEFNAEFSSAFSAELASSAQHNEAFILIGQSNADGRGVISSLTMPKSPNVWLLEKNGTYRIATEPISVQGVGWVNNIPSDSSPGAPAGSFGLAMGKSVAALTGITPVLVPCAIGSTYFKHWIPPDVIDDMTSLYGATTARTKATVVRNSLPVFCLFGMESESHLTTETMATGAISKGQYMGGFTGLYKHLMDDFPGASLLYAQLSASNDAALATKHRLTGHVQVMSEDNGSASSPVNVTLTPGSAQNTNATNTITVLSSKSFRIVGDGTTTLGYSFDGLEANTKYLIEFSLLGTGGIKVQNSGSEIASAVNASDPQKLYSLIFTTGSINSPTILYFYRNAPNNAVNMIITIRSAMKIITESLPRAHMVVTHDVPRNAGADSIHVSTIGQNEVGRRFALAYAQNVLKLPVDGTGPRLVSVTSVNSTSTQIKFTQKIADAKAGETNYSDGTNSLIRVYDGGTERAVSTVVVDPSDDTALLVTHAACSGVRCVTYGDRAGQDAAWRKGVIYNTAELPLPAPMFGPVVSV
jgi:hypothetical protein